MLSNRVRDRNGDRLDNNLIQPIERGCRCQSAAGSGSGRYFFSRSVPSPGDGASRNRISTLNTLSISGQCQRQQFPSCHAP
jgi:hypothetical protein